MVDEPTGDDDPEEPAAGYAWTFEEQERNLPEAEYLLHLAILDEHDEEDLERFDPEGRSDYILWAAAQALEEADRGDLALDLLKRIAASRAPHPALFYPDILLRLGEALRDRGDYDAALEILDRVEREDPGLGDLCGERRAEVLVLSGDLKKGLWLFEKAAGRAPDDPWPPLTAAWALLQRGEHARIAEWLDRAGRALDRCPDEDEARAAAAELDRLKAEAGARRRRSQSRGEAGAGAGAPGPGGSDPGAPAAAGSDPGGMEPPAPPGTDPPGLRARREAILGEVDAEEIRLVDRPPRDEGARAAAARRIASLYARASRAWDDAVEAGDEEMIAAFDDLQAEIAGMAERFGVPVPEDAGD